MSTAAATDTALGKETLPQILRLKLADGDHCFDASSAATAETVIEDGTDVGAILNSTAEDNDGVMRVEDCQESSADISGLRLCGCATEEGEVSTGGSGCDNHSAPSSIQYYYEDAIRSIVMHEGQIVPKRFRDSTNGEVFTAVVIPRRIPSQGTGTLASSAGPSSIHHQPARDPFFPYGSVKLVLSHHQRRWESEPLPIGEREVVIRVKHASRKDDQGTLQVLHESWGIARIDRRVMVNCTAMTASTEDASNE